MRQGYSYIQINSHSFCILSAFYSFQYGIPDVTRASSERNLCLALSLNQKYN